MKVLSFLISSIISFALISQVRISRVSDLEFSNHLYRVIKVPINVDGDIDHWVFWMADDLKPTSIDSVMDMKTQKDQRGSGKFNNGAFDSIAFNYVGAVKSCPTGWRLPKIEDWDTLVDILTEQQRMAFFGTLEGSKEIKYDTVEGNAVRREVRLSGGYYWSFSESEDDPWRIEIEKNYYNVSRRKSDISNFHLVRCIRNEEE